MTTANDIIKAAFRISGVTVKGEAPDADETQDALSSLNDLMESLSNESLFVYANTLESFVLSSGQLEYTIGSGGDFDTVRPTAIVSAYIRSGTIDYFMSSIPDDVYSRIILKSVQGIPEFYNYSTSYTLGKIKLYPAPSSGQTLFVLSEKPLTTFTLNQTVSLPPGWNRYLKNQLAIEIAAEYGQPIPETAVLNAREAMQLIKQATARAKSMDNTPLDGKGGNVYSGWYN